MSFFSLSSQIRGPILRAVEPTSSPSVLTLHSRPMPPFYCVSPCRSCRQVSSHELRYAVGAILSDGVTPEPAGLRQRVEKYGFKVATFPAIEHAVLAAFPFSATFSIVIAIWKVYPALKEYIKVGRRRSDAQIRHRTAEASVVPLPSRATFSNPSLMPKIYHACLTRVSPLTTFL